MDCGKRHFKGKWITFKGKLLIKRCIVSEALKKSLKLSIFSTFFCFSQRGLLEQFPLKKIIFIEK